MAIHAIDSPETLFYHPADRSGWNIIKKIIMTTSLPALAIIPGQTMSLELGEQLNLHDNPYETVRIWLDRHGANVKLANDAFTRTVGFLSEYIHAGEVLHPGTEYIIKTRTGHGSITLGQAHTQESAVFLSLRFIPQQGNEVDPLLLAFILDDQLRILSVIQLDAEMQINETATDQS